MRKYLYKDTTTCQAQLLVAFLYIFEKYSDQTVLEFRQIELFNGHA